MTEDVHTRVSVAEDLTAAGLATGDVVLIHSRFKAVGKVEGGPEGFLAALSDCVGDAGTLIFPTFNFGFCQGEAFDVRRTASHMGLLSELARRDPRSTRVAHPIYSFAVLGRLAGEAGEIRNTSSYGADSLFGKLREWNGKILVIGLPYNNSVTFFHHVEEILGCSYRHMEEFEGTVVDGHGVAETRTVTMFARNEAAGVVTDVEPMGELLEREGVVTLGHVGAAETKVMRAREVFDVTARHFSDAPGLLYRVEPKTT